MYFADNDEKDDKLKEKAEIAIQPKEDGFQKLLVLFIDADGFDFLSLSFSFL